MLKTKNFNLNKPELNDTVDISKLNENADIIDTKIKEIETKANNITVPVQSVNNKTGAVVLNSTDIKCTDGTTIEQKFKTKANTFNVSDNVHSTSSTDVASSKAVYTTFNKATQAYDLAGTKQDFTVINEKFPHETPGTYPLGYSTFYTNDNSWKESCSVNGYMYAVVETCHAKSNYGITQKITWFLSDNSIHAIFQRASYTASTWGNWVRILDNNSISSSTTSTSTTDIANSYAVKQAMDKANEAFTSASNGKELISNAITGKGVNASNTDTFPILANKISSISTGVVPPWSVKNMQDTWIEGSGNRPGFNFHHGMCKVGNKVYLIGGWNTGTHTDNLIYDTLTDTWSQGAEPQQNQSSTHFCANVGNYIYFLEGNTSTMSVHKYDIKLNKWVDKKQVPNFNITSYHTASCIGNIVYLFDLIGKIAMYDVTTNTITYEKGPSYGGGIVTNGVSSAVDGDTIYVLYTDYDDNRAIKSYNTVTHNWSMVTIMNDKENISHLGYINYSSMVCLNKELYVMGGFGRYRDGGSTDINNVFIYNIETNTWRNGQNMIKKASRVYAIVVGNNIYDLGTEGKYYANVYIPKFNL